MLKVKVGHIFGQGNTKARWAIPFLMLTLLAGAFARDPLAWPFVAFSMYSYMNPDFPVSLELEGIPRQGADFPLRLNRYFHPYDFQDVISQLSAKAPNARPELLLRTLKVYEKARRSGWHEGPELAGIRLTRFNLRSRERTVLLESRWP